MKTEEIEKTVRAYVVQEFLTREDAARLTDSTPLITGGLLGSLGTLKLVTFLEESYGISIETHELNVERLNNIAEIAAFVHSKL